MSEINENEILPFAFDKNEIVPFTFNDNQILPFTFDYIGSSSEIKRNALCEFTKAYNITYDRTNWKTITVLNQKIKNHSFIEKLFNLHLYE